MQNRIDQVLTFSEQERYLVIDQGIYHNKSYLFVCQVSEDGTELTDHFSILEESEKDGKPTAKMVKDLEVLKKVTAYFKKRQESLED